MTTQPIRFYHQGRIVSVDGVHPTRTVLDWLREDARCTGTKEGCNEGDCGACTVVIGELGPPAGTTAVPSLRLQTVNACIRFLPTLAGKALFTVEDLRPIAGGALHPAQQAMVDCHGSQCGFCTPGFVMSLWAAYERHGDAATRPTRQQLADELSGNLCRCTGYRPILDAGQRMFDLPAARLGRAPVVAALQSLAAPAASAGATPATATPADATSADALSTGAASAQPTFEYAAPARHLPGAADRRDRFFAPRTLAALAALRARLPGARLLAGATDIGLWVNKQFKDVGDLIYVGDVAELKRIATVDGTLVIGAGASLEQAWAALSARFEGLVDVWYRFASPPVRHAGTMGGNVANGSPIGDAPPVLLALDASLVLRTGNARRSLPLAEFYLDYMKNRLAPGEFIEAIQVPLPPDGAPRPAVRAYKISKRFDCDISALLGAFALTRDAGGIVTSVRLAFGGMAAICKRAAAAEAALLGQPWGPASLAAAKAALATDFKPLSDMRASDGHRLLVAGNLLERFWLETRTTDPLPADAVSVFAVMPHDA
ncbi:MAG: xanthine dehydrogenase small subunit [Lautropia sp.]